MTDNKQYPPLPAPDTHCFDEDTGKDVWSYSADQMRAYVDADRAMRAAQAAPAAVAVPDDRCQHCVNRSDGFYGSFAPECPLHNDDGTAHKGDKQRARDAYAAGMGDPLVVAAPAPAAQVDALPPRRGRS